MTYLDTTPGIAPSSRLKLPDVTCDDGTVIKSTDPCAAQAVQDAAAAYAALRSNLAVAMLELAEQRAAGEITQQEYADELVELSNNFRADTNGVIVQYAADVKAACCGKGDQAVG